MAGSYTTTNGQTRAATDVWFGVNNMHSIAEEWLEVPDDIAALPNLQGYGKVYDLHQAMARDNSGTLKDLVSQFVNAGPTADHRALLEQIIFHWTRHVAPAKFLPGNDACQQKAA